MYLVIRECGEELSLGWASREAEVEILFEQEQAARGRERQQYLCSVRAGRETQGDSRYSKMCWQGRVSSSTEQRTRKAMGIGDTHLKASPGNEDQQTSHAG
jgi:hypothetical protein